MALYLKYLSVLVCVYIFISPYSEKRYIFKQN